MCSAQCALVPREHLSQVNQVLIVVRQCVRGSHTELADNQRLQQRRDTSPREREAEPQFELHQRIELLGEPPIASHAERRITNTGGRLAGSARTAGRVQPRGIHTHGPKSVRRLHLDPRGKRRNRGARQTQSHIARETSTEG